MTLKHLVLKYDELVIDLWKGDHCKAEYLAINPLGQIPTIVDGDNILAQRLSL